MKTFICVSTNCWDAKWERMQQISLSLSDHGKVLYLEPIYSIRHFCRFLKTFFALFFPDKFVVEKKENLFIYPLIAILPFSAIKFVNDINKFLLIRAVNKVKKRLSMENCILIIWDFWEADKFIGYIDESLVVFDYFDNYVAYHNYSDKEKEQICAIIAKSMQRSDLVFASSIKLLEYAKKYNSNVHLLPNGVDMVNYFKKHYDVCADMNSISRPIIGYMGGNNFEHTSDKIDFDLLLNLTKRLQKFSFVFIGPIDEVSTRNDKLRVLREGKNVYFLGRKNPDELPSYINYFDICIIPWKINEFTMYAYPLKLNEYLACGKPVVTTALPDMVKFDIEAQDIIKIANNCQEFANKINVALEEDNKKLVEKRINIAKNNSWDKRVIQMVKAMETKLNPREQVQG